MYTNVRFTYLMMQEKKQENNTTAFFTGSWAFQLKNIEYRIYLLFNSLYYNVTDLQGYELLD